MGHDVVVANPAKLRMIYQNPSKCDRADAMMLARVARLDRALLSPIHHRSRGTQQDLQLLQTRNALVKTRTQWINHMRGLAKALGYRLPSCSAPSFHKRVAKDLPEALRETMGPLLELMGRLTERIAEYTKKIELMCRDKYPQAATSALDITFSWKNDIVFGVFNRAWGYVKTLGRRPDRSPDFVARLRENSPEDRSS